MVLHSCVCVYLLYASNVAIFVADHFASFYVLCNKQLKIFKNRCSMFYVSMFNLWECFGWVEL